MDMLSSKRLQKIITDIDESKDRFEELEKELSNNEHFAAFMKDVMVELGYCNPDGTYKG